jgi:hypothetical protein
VALSTLSTLPVDDGDRPPIPTPVEDVRRIVEVPFLPPMPSLRATDVQIGRRGWPI